MERSRTKATPDRLAVAAQRRGMPLDFIPPARQSPRSAGEFDQLVDRLLFKRGGLCDGKCGEGKGLGAAVRAEVGERKRKKCGERMWLWWWAGARFATYGAAMVTNTSRVEARRRVREAQARANEARAQRERANVEDAATLVVATGRVSEVDAWESERLAEVREQVRAEANKRRGDYRAEAGGAVARMQHRGETLATIAGLAGVGVGELRAMLRYAPKTENHTAGDVSGALGGDAGSAGDAAASATAVTGDVVSGAAAGVPLGNGHAASA